MSEGKPPSSLEDIDTRLRQARARGKPRGRKASENRSSIKGAGLAMRIGVELVAGLIVGVGIGLLLDRWLGTTPWMLVGFFFMGAAAGMMNMYRTVRRLEYGAGYKPAETKKTPTDPDDRQD